MSHPLDDPAMRDQVIDAMKVSVQQAFETMAFMKVECDGLTPKTKGAPRGALSGSIGLTGRATAADIPLRGNIALVFPNMDLAKVVFRSMMMMEPGSEVNVDEIKDAVGELANMVAGGAKSQLQDNGFDIGLGLPTVVVGENHYLEVPADTVSFVVPVKAEAGTFFLTLSFN
jgi:chemotaxis protein CheX